MNNVIDGFVVFPTLSKYFNVDDIHKLREWNYERRKNMTDEEIKKELDDCVDIMEKRINFCRKNNKIV
jgi:hypothetical protein